MYAGGVARIEDCIDANPFTQCIRGEIVTLHLIISYKYSTRSKDLSAKTYTNTKQ